MGTELVAEDEPVADAASLVEAEPLPDIDPRYARAAVEACTVMALEVAGVDMLETRGGPRILEINSSPGLEGIEKSTSVDVATSVIRHAERYLKRRKQGRGSFPGASERAIDDERVLRRRRSR